MYWNNFLTTATTSIFCWRLVAKEIVGICLAWGAYSMASMLVQDPALKDAMPSWAMTLVPLLFWPTVVISAISFVVASVKFSLPAAVAWILIAPLYMLDFIYAAKVALFAANAVVVLYAIGFTFHGGRLRVDTRK